MASNNLNINIRHCKLIQIQEISDGIDGCIRVAESLKNIPFEIKRIYFISDFKNPDAKRGKHAHKQIEQMIFCVKGSFILGVDDGKSKMDIMMDNPSTGIYLGVKLWHTMKSMSKDCLMLVLASDHYIESDYIRNYEEFLKYIGE